jgi:hypothetical protein
MADTTYAEARQFDLDTGGGIDYVEVQGSVFAASGGAVLVGGVLETGTNAVGAWAAGGATPHDSVDSGNPIKVGGYAKTAAPTAVSDADRVNAWFSPQGMLNVVLRDTSGNYASASGTTQYVEDVAFGGNGTGTLMIARRDDALAVLTPIEDDAVGLRVQNRGALWVAIADGSGNQITSFGGGTQYVEDVALGAVGSATGTLSIGRASASAPTSVSADNDAVGLWASRFGALNVILRDTSGTFVPTGTQYAADSAVGVTATGTIILGRASTAVPTAVSADGDAVAAWANSAGALVTGYSPHVALVGSPWTLTSKTAQYTTTQTSADLIAAVASTTIVVTSVQIQAGGTTAGALQLYFGTGAYSRGTNKAVFDGEFAPSATLKPGVVMSGPFVSASADALKVTTSAAISPLTITVWYYVVT